MSIPAQCENCSLNEGTCTLALRNLQELEKVLTEMGLGAMQILEQHQNRIPKNINCENEVKRISTTVIH